MLGQHEKKKSEFQEWTAAVEQALAQKDAAAKEAVLVFQKITKHVFRWLFLPSISGSFWGQC